MTFTPIIIDALGTVTKILIKEVETIQIITLLSEYWEESCRLEETYCHSNFGKRPSANADVKNSQGVK